MFTTIYRKILRYLKRYLKKIKLWSNIAWYVRCLDVCKILSWCMQRVSCFGLTWNRLKIFGNMRGIWHIWRFIYLFSDISRIFTVCVYFQGISEIIIQWRWINSIGNSIVDALLSSAPVETLPKFTMPPQAELTIVVVVRNTYNTWDYIFRS